MVNGKRKNDIKRKKHNDKALRTCWEGCILEGRAFFGSELSIVPSLMGSARSEL